MFKTDKEQSILNSHKRKEMLSLYRSLVLQISKMKLKDIQVDVSASFKDDFSFNITAFDSADSSNGTFSAYGFTDVSVIKNDSALVMAAIKSDSFDEFDRVLKGIRVKNYPAYSVID